MTEKEVALALVVNAAYQYQRALNDAEDERKGLARACQEAYDAGVNDREMSEAVATVGLKLSRSRIQQYRKGDPKRKVAAS